MANWKESLYGNPPTALPDSQLQSAPNTRPVDVHYYVEASFIISGVLDRSPLLLAYVSWMLPHQKRYAIGKPAELWYRRRYENNYGIHSFVPIDSLSCRCAHGMIIHDEENLCVVIPLVE